MKACTQVTSDDLINAVFDTLEPFDGEGRDHRPKNIKRALTKLELDANAPIAIKDGFVTWLGSQDDFESASSASSPYRGDALTQHGDAKWSKNL